MASYGTTSRHLHRSHLYDSRYENRLLLPTLTPSPAATTTHHIDGRNNSNACSNRMGSSSTVGSLGLQEVSLLRYASSRQAVAAVAEGGGPQAEVAGGGGGEGGSGSGTLASTPSSATASAVLTARDRSFEYGQAQVSAKSTVRRMVDILDRYIGNSSSGSSNAMLGHYVSSSGGNSSGSSSNSGGSSNSSSSGDSSSSSGGSSSSSGGSSNSSSSSSSSGDSSSSSGGSSSSSGGGSSSREGLPPVAPGDAPLFITTHPVLAAHQAVAAGAGLAAHQAVAAGVGLAAQQAVAAGAGPAAQQAATAAAGGTFANLVANRNFKSCCGSLIVRGEAVRAWPASLYAELLAYALEPGMHYEATKAVSQTAWALWVDRNMTREELYLYFKVGDVARGGNSY